MPPPPPPPPPPETPLRSCCSSRLAMVQPPFSGPTRFSFGTFTSVKKVSQNGEAPAISRIGRTSTPGSCMSISRKEMPSCFLEVSVRTRQKHMSAHCPPEVQILQPLTRKWSPLSSALVESEARSEPAPGSEKPWHQRTSCLAMARMCCCFCSSLPYSSRVGPNIIVPMPPTGFQAPRRFISCCSARASAWDRPPPPYWVGQVGTPQPLSAMAL